MKECEECIDLGYACENCSRYDYFSLKKILKNAVDNNIIIYDFESRGTEISDRLLLSIRKSMCSKNISINKYIVSNDAIFEIYSSQHAEHEDYKLKTLTKIPTVENIWLNPNQEYDKSKNLYDFFRDELQGRLPDYKEYLLLIETTDMEYYLASY